MTGRTVLRSRLNVAFFGAVALVCALFVLAGVVSPFLETDDLAGGLLKWAPVTVVTLILAVFFFRCAAMRVVVHDDYIRIVNPLRSHLVGWHEIDKIDTARDPTWVVRVWTGGTPIRAYGLSRLGGVGLPTDILAGDATPAWLTDRHTALQRRRRHH